MQLELDEILGGIFEDDRKSDTWLLGKRLRTLIGHKYSDNVSGFSEDIRKIELPIVDATTFIRTDDEDEAIVQVN